MIVSELIDMPLTKNLTKSLIEDFFKEVKINPVKWAVTGVFRNKIEILVSFEKKTL